MSKESKTASSCCSSDVHSGHLCSLVSDNSHINEPDEYRELVKDAQFKCESCGRVAKSEKHLCYPTAL